MPPLKGITFLKKLIDFPKIMTIPPHLLTPKLISAPNYPILAQLGDSQFWQCQDFESACISNTSLSDDGQIYLEEFGLDIAWFKARGRFSWGSTVREGFSSFGWKKMPRSRLHLQTSLGFKPATGLNYETGF